MTNVEAARRVREHMAIHDKLHESNAFLINIALYKAIDMLELPELHWIETAQREPEEYEHGEQVFTLPVTLNGKADLTYTHHVGDDPARYPYWMSIDTVLDLLSKMMLIQKGALVLQ